MNALRIALLGARGAVGREMLSLLERMDLPVSELVPYGTARSAGATVSFRGREYSCRELSESSVEAVDLVLASAGATASRRFCPLFAQAGAFVVDNSSAWRADPDCPLVVPEVNAHALTGNEPIIANPNCSTIQMVVALAPLHRKWGLRRVTVATYQSVSGAGARAVQELLAGTRAVLDGDAETVEIFPHPMAFNVLPQIGMPDDEGEMEEEIKMRRETRRIFDLPELPVSATCVRVPVVRAHSEAVWVAFEQPPDPAEARRLLGEAGLRVIDRPGEGLYPLAREEAGRNGVAVGRVRRDPADDRGLCLWVVADNLLKGAATNALQIVEVLRERGFLPRGPGG